MAQGGIKPVPSLEAFWHMGNLLNQVSYSGTPSQINNLPYQTSMATHTDNSNFKVKCFFLFTDTSNHLLISKLHKAQLQSTLNFPTPDTVCSCN